MTKLSQDDLLDVLRASSDAEYIRPLETEDDGAGFDLYRAIAAQLARASDAVEVSQQAMYIFDHSEQTEPSASGGAQATGNLLISRAAPTDGDIELVEGELLYVVLTGPDAEVLVEAEIEVATDTTFAAGVSGPLTVPVRAVRIGYHGNLPETEASGGRAVIFKQWTTKTLSTMVTTTLNRVAAAATGDQFDDGSIGLWLRFTAGPNIGTGPRKILTWNDSTLLATVDGAALVVSAANDAEIVDLEELGFTAELDGDLTGGAAAMLDMLGHERGMGRGVDESDPTYKERLRYLPDTIAPNAIYRAVSRILTPIPVPFEFIESRDPNVILGGAWDDMAWDDPATYNGLTERDHFFWQGDRFQYQGFYVVVERQWYGDFGFPWDTKWPGASNFPDNAWDWGAWDGYPLGFWNDLYRMIDEVEKARMSGVPWLIVLVDSL